MSSYKAAERINMATSGDHALTTHRLATLLLKLPDLPLTPIEQQGGPEAWSEALHDDVDVQVGIRSW